MQRVLVILALLCSVAVAQTYLHSCNNSDESPTDYTSMACTLTVTGGAGHAIVAWGSYYQGGVGCEATAASAADTAGNIYTIRTQATGVDVVDCNFLLVATGVTGNTSNTVTVSWGVNASFVSVGAAEFSGVGVFDAAATPFNAARGAWTPPMSTTVTTASAGDLLFGFGITGGSGAGTVSPGTGFTGIATGTSGVSVAEYATGGAAGSNAVTVAATSGVGYGMLLAVALVPSSPPASYVPRHHGGTICCAKEQ